MNNLWGEEREMNCENGDKEVEVSFDWVVSEWTTRDTCDR